MHAEWVLEEALLAAEASENRFWLVADAEAGRHGQGDLVQSGGSKLMQIEDVSNGSLALNQFC